MSVVLDLLVLLILIVTVVCGYRRGFIQTMLQLVVWVASFALALFLSSPIATAAFDGLFAEGIEIKLSESLQNMPSLAPAEQVEALLEELPDPITSVLENNDDLKTMLNELEKLQENSTATANSVAHSLVSNVVRPVAVMLLRFVVFLILFIVLLFLLRLVKNLIKPVSKLPIIHTVDGILGAVLGAAKGLIYVLAVVSMIQICAALAAPDAAFSQKTVEDTVIVSWIADINPITSML